MAIDFDKLLDKPAGDKPRRRRTRLGRSSDPTSGGDFSKGVARGIDQTQALGYGVASLLGDAIDAESLQRWGLEGYRRNMKEAELNKARIGRVEDIDGLGDAIDWGQGVLGELVPSIATMALGGGVGGAIAKKAAKTAVEKELAKKIAKGQIAGAAAASVGMETGEIYGDVAQEGYTGAKAIGASILGGTVAGALDTILPVQVAKKIGLAGGLKKKITQTMLKNAKKRGLRGRMGIEGLKGLGTEGATEFAQTAIEEATKAFIKDEGLPEDISSMLLNATAAGMLGGGVMGGIAGFPKGPVQEALDKQQTAERTDVNPVTQEAFGNTKAAKFGQRLAELDKAIKGSGDLAQKSSLVEEAAAIIDDIELEVNPPKEVGKDGKAKVTKPKLKGELKEFKDLLDYYGPSYRGKADIEITDVAPETVEERQARVKDEKLAKRMKKKLDKQRGVEETAIKEADKIVTEEANVEKEVLQEAAGTLREETQRLIAEVEQIVRPQAGFDRDNLPPLEKPPEVQESEVPAFLQGRDGLPPQNGLPAVSQTEQEKTSKVWHGGTWDGKADFQNEQGDNILFASKAKRFAEQYADEYDEGARVTELDIRDNHKQLDLRNNVFEGEGELNPQVSEVLEAIGLDPTDKGLRVSFYKDAGAITYLNRQTQLLEYAKKNGYQSILLPDSNPDMSSTTMTSMVIIDPSIIAGVTPGDIRQRESEVQVPSETDTAGDDVVVGQDDLVMAPVDPQVIEEEATAATERRPKEIEEKVAQGVSGATVKTVPDDYDAMIVENIKTLIQADNTDRTNIVNFLEGFDRQTGLDYSSRIDEFVNTAIDSLVADTQKPRAQKKTEEKVTEVKAKTPPLDDGEVARRLSEIPIAGLRKALAGKGVKGVSKMKKPDLLEQVMERMGDPEVFGKASDILRQRDAKKTNIKQAKEERVAQRKAKMQATREKRRSDEEAAEIEAATKEVWDDAEADDLYNQAQKIAALRKKEQAPIEDSLTSGIPENESQLSEKEQRELEAKRFEEETLRDLEDDYGVDMDNFPDDVYAAGKPDTSGRKFISTAYDTKGNFLNRQDTPEHRAWSKRMKMMEDVFNEMVDKISNPNLDDIEFTFVKNVRDLRDDQYAKMGLVNGRPDMAGLNWKGMHTQWHGQVGTSIQMNPTAFWSYKDDKEAIAQFKKTFLHEFVGHYGLRRLFDSGRLWTESPYDMFLDKVVKSNPAIARKALSLADRWSEYISLEEGTQLQARKNSRGETVMVTKEAMRQLTDEYLAELAKTSDVSKLNKVDRQVLKKLITWVKHKLMPLLGVHSFAVTNTDIQNMIAQSYSNLYGEGIVRPTQKTAHSLMGAAQRNTPIKEAVGKAIAKDKKGEVVHYEPTGEGYNAAVDDGVIDNEGTNQKEERIRALEAMRDQGLDVSDILAVEAVQSPGYGSLRQNAVSNMAAKYYKRLQNAFPGFFQIMTPRGNLQKYDMKNAQAMKALGKMGKHFAMAKEASVLLKGLSAAQSEAVIEYMTNDRADINNINVKPKVRDALVKYKEEIVQLGEKLVQLNLLPPEAFASREGKYLPIRYLAYASRVTGAGRKASPLDYLRKRNPSINEEQQNMMGEIVDPQFIIPEALSLIGRDVALLEYMETIRTLDREANLGWILGDKSIERYNPHGDGMPAEVSVVRAEELLEMHRDILKDYAAGNLTTQATEADIREHVQAVQWYEKTIADYKQRLEEKVKTLAGVPLDTHLPESEWSKALGDRYKKMPEDMGYGALKGQWVRTEIFDEFNESKWFQEDLAGISKAVGPGGLVDRGNQIWKTMKVPFNLPSWLRNGIGNFVLMDIATSTNSGKLLGMLVEEAQRAMNKNPSQFWVEAHKRGLFGTTFSANEIFLLSEQASVARRVRIAKEMKDGKSKFKSARMRMWGAFVEVSEMASQGYGNLEGIFKTVAMRDYVTRWQKENGVESLNDLAPEQREAVLNESVIHANKAIFDYSELTAWQKDLRRNALGAPFITYTMKALPAVARGIGQNPQKFIKYLALPYAFAGMAAMGLSDVSPEELEEWAKVQPQWMKDKSSIYVLPMKDANGKLQPMDFGYWFPWAPWQDLAMKTMTNFKGKEGVMEYTRATYESAWEGVNGLGLLGGPLPTTIAALTTGKETFLGRDIVDAGDSAGVAMAKQWNWLYTMWAPPFLTNQGVAGKLMDHFDSTVLGLPNRNVDAFGEQKATLGATLLRGAGVSTYPTSLREGALRRKQNFERQLRELKTAKRKAIKNRGWSQERRVKEVKDINRRIQVLRKKHQDE